MKKLVLILFHKVFPHLYFHKEAPNMYVYKLGSFMGDKKIIFDCAYNVIRLGSAKRVFFGIGYFPQYEKSESAAKKRWGDLVIDEC